MDIKENIDARFLEIVVEEEGEEGVQVWKVVEEVVVDDFFVADVGLDEGGVGGEDRVEEGQVD